MNDVRHMLVYLQTVACHHTNASPMTMFTRSIMQDLADDGFGGCDNSADAKYYDKFAGESYIAE